MTQRQQQALIRQIRRIESALKMANNMAGAYGAGAAVLLSLDDIARPIGGAIRNVEQDR